MPYQYDGRGNLISDGTVTYGYDAADRLTRVTLPDATSVRYAYDAGQQLVQQTVGTAVTNYLWDDLSLFGDIVLETDGSGTIQATYTYGAQELLAQQRQGENSYYLRDGQQSTRALTAADGTMTEQYTYDAFGNLLHQQGGTTTPYQYTGQQFDHATGLYYLRSRFYDPVLGRFLSADTAAIDLAHPSELNRYLYVSSNPIRYYDPTGYVAGEYGALNDGVSDNTQNGMEVAGWLIGRLYATVDAGMLAIQARDMQIEAKKRYATNHSLEKFPEPAVARPSADEGSQGWAGPALAEFKDINGQPQRLAALNDVGLRGYPELNDNKNKSQYDRLHEMYQELQKIRKQVAEERGFRVVNEGRVLPGGPNVTHAELYLQAELQNMQGLIPPKGTVALGVPQNTICGTCQHALIPADDVVLGNSGLYSVLDSNDRKGIVVVGNKLVDNLGTKFSPRWVR